MLVDPKVHYSKDVPYSYWVEKQHTGAFYNSKPADSLRAFNRNNGFLNEFHHYTHKMN